MGASQRRKGKRGELEVVQLAHAAGFLDARRSGDAGQIDGDVGPIPGAYLEVRRREQLSIEAWAREVEAEALKRGRGELPVLLFRTSGEPWRAELPAVRLLELLAWQAAAEDIMRRARAMLLGPDLQHSDSAERALELLEGILGES